MCLLLRNTLRRGRSCVPFTFLRMRSLRRSLPTIFMPMVVSSSRTGGHYNRPLVLLLAALARLASLLTHALSAVADAFAAVRLRGTEPANLRGRLPDGLFVGAGEDEDGALGVCRDSRRD